MPSPDPKQGNKRPVWLRTRKDDSITGLETGEIQKTFGSYGTKLVLRYGGLNINTRAVEVGIGTLRETRKCPSGGWPFKLQTQTAQGTDSVTFRGKCAKSGG